MDGHSFYLCLSRFPSQSLPVPSYIFHRHLLIVFYLFFSLNKNLGGITVFSLVYQGERRRRTPVTAALEPIGSAAGSRVVCLFFFVSKIFLFPPGLIDRRFIIGKAPARVLRTGFVGGRMRRRRRTRRRRRISEYNRRVEQRSNPKTGTSARCDLQRRRSWQRQFCVFF